MDAVLLIIRYIPFWAVPLGIISFEFGRTFWFKGYRIVGLGFLGLLSLCGLAVLVYVWSGSPDKATANIINFSSDLLK